MKKGVLLIDDDVKLRKLLREYLEETHIIYWPLGLDDSKVHSLREAYKLTQKALSLDEKIMIA